MRRRSAAAPAPRLCRPSSTSRSSRPQATPKYSAVRMPSAVAGQAVAGAVADEEDAVLDRRAHPVRDPVALVAVGGEPEVVREPDRRLAHVVARVERADADAHLVAGGEAPAVAAPHVARVEPQLEVVARRRGVHLEAARERGLRRLDAPARGDSTRRQPSASTISGAVRSPRSVCSTSASPAPAVRPWTFAVSKRAAPHCSHSPAQLAVVERRERPRQLPAQRRRGRVDDERRNVWRIEPSRPRAWSHSVGAAHADVWRSPIS